MAQYAAGREQFGKPIGEKQSIQWMIAETAAESRSAPLAGLPHGLDGRHGPALHGPGCGRQAVWLEIASRAIDRACKSTARWAIAAISRSSARGDDARIGEIFEGTNEIQRIVIAENVLTPYGVRVRP